MNVGDVFGRLTCETVDVARSLKYRSSVYDRFRCACGEEHIARRDHVESGKTKNCPKCKGASTRTHGQANKTGTYNSWDNMIQRCTNPNRTEYRLYGGRGIKVCDRWVAGFQNFYADMGDRPPGTSLDRIDSAGDYCPENCRWASLKLQGNNTSRNRYVEIGGDTKTVKQWSEELGISYKLVYERYGRGWDLKDALLTKPGERRKC